MRKTWLLVLVGFFSLFLLHCGGELPQGKEDGGQVESSQQNEIVKQEPASEPKDISEAQEEVTSEELSSEQTADAGEGIVPEEEKGLPEQASETVQEATPEVIPEKQTSFEPTWALCRRLFLAKTLTTEQKKVCETRYRKAPTVQEYGLRFTILNEAPSPDWKTKITKALQILNDTYKPVGIRFRTVTTKVLSGLKMDKIDGTKYAFSEISGDIQKHLDLKSNDPKVILQEFKKRLAAQGVSARMLANFKPETKVNANTWFSRLGRIHSDTLGIFIVKSFTTSGVAGLGTNRILSNPEAITSAWVFLKKTIPGHVLAHEVGHYLGLGHTHKQKLGVSYTSPISELDYKSLVTVQPKTLNVVNFLKRKLGTRLDKPFALPYLSYDAASTATVDFLNYYKSLKNVWIWTHMAYKEKFVPFKDLNEFITWGQSGKKMYAKNFIRRSTTGQNLSWSGNNCKYDRTKKAIRCRYGDPSSWSEATSSFLNEIILFQKGQSCNVMSYITAAQKSPGVRHTKFFSKEQIDIIKFGLRSPFYGLLRNYALDKTR